MSQEPFGDIPLFREIQRLLAAGGGPVNYEIARQVAGAIAAPGSSEGPFRPEDTRAASEAVATAEGVLRGYTRLPGDEPLSVSLVGRSWWITSTLDAWRWILEHLAMRYTRALGGIGPESGGEGGETNPMEAAMGQIAPLLMGIQIGTLMGHLARELLGRYDIPIPRDDDGRLYLIEPNIASLATDYEIDVDALRKWVALHESARGILSRSVTWVTAYFRSLLFDLVDSIEIDTSELENRIIELQSRGMEALQEGMRIEAALPMVPSERHDRALERIQALLALFEGYAHHACRQVASALLDGPERIDEIMARRAAAPSEGESALSGMLGFSFDRSLEQAGITFCAAVVSLRSGRELNRVWEAPDNLPSLAEIRDPFAWIERVLESQT